MTIQIEGLDGLIIKLHLTEAAVDDETATAALLAGGRILVEEVQANIVSRGLVKKGKLRDSVIVKKTETLAVSVYSKMNWAKIHEFGGVISVKKAPFLVFNAGSGVRKVKMVHIPARPFMRPAVEAKQRAAIDKIAEVLSQKLRDVIGF